MKITQLLIGCAIALLTGCQSAAPSSPGTATLRLNVVAEPKSGAVVADTHVLVYDSPRSFGYGSSNSSDPNAFEVVDYSALDDIVVWLEPADEATTGAGTASPAAIDIDPRKASSGLAAAVGVGQKIVFHNTGPKPANLYSVSDGNEFDLGVIPSGATSEYATKSTGLIEVWTDSLQEPVARIYVAPTCWVRLTRSGTTLEFDDLPPGKWQIASWHPRLPGHQVSVDLLPDRVNDASIQVSVNGLPTVEPR